MDRVIWCIPNNIPECRWGIDMTRLRRIVFAVLGLATLSLLAMSCGEDEAAFRGQIIGEPCTNDEECEGSLEGAYCFWNTLCSAPCSTNYDCGCSASSTCPVVCVFSSDEDWCLVVCESDEDCGTSQRCDRESLPSTGLCIPSFLQ